VTVYKSYKSVYRRAGLVFIAIALLASVEGLWGEGFGDAAVNYYRLREKYIEWNDGLFGSRSYKKKQLKYYLADLEGNNITTGYDFLLDPDSASGSGRFSSDIVYNKWLRIHGEFDTALKDIGFPPFSSLLRDKEINKRLFAVSGRVKGFRLEETFRGRYVHLYMENVRIEPAGKEQAFR